MEAARARAEDAARRIRAASGRGADVCAIRWPRATPRLFKCCTPWASGMRSFPRCSPSTPGCCRLWKRAPRAARNWKRSWAPCARSSTTVSAELKSSQQQAAALNAQAKRNEAEIHACEPIWLLRRVRPAPTWSCCEPAIGAAISIRICFATWTPRSVRRMRLATRSKPSATGCKIDWPPRGDDCRARRDDRAAAKRRCGPGQLGRRTCEASGTGRAAAHARGPPSFRHSKPIGRD